MWDDFWLWLEEFLVTLAEAHQDDKLPLPPPPKLPRL